MIKAPSITLICALTTAIFTTAAGSALADDNRPWLECQVPTKSGKQTMTLSIQPTGTRDGSPAYLLTTVDADKKSAVPLEDDPLIYEFEFNQTQFSNTKDAFSTKFHFMYGFFSTLPGDAALTINKATGDGAYHRKTLLVRHLFSANLYATVDLKLTGCKEVPNPYLPNAEAADKSAETRQADGGAAKSVAATTQGLAQGAPPASGDPVRTAN